MPFSLISMIKKECQKAIRSLMSEWLVSMGYSVYIKDSFVVINRTPENRFHVASNVMLPADRLILVTSNRDLGSHNQKLWVHFCGGFDQKV